MKLRIKTVPVRMPRDIWREIKVIAARQDRPAYKVLLERLEAGKGNQRCRNREATANESKP